MEVHNHPSGGLLGVKLKNGHFQLMIISAYLPQASIDAVKLKYPGPNLTVKTYHASKKPKISTPQPGHGSRKLIYGFLPGT
jgi:hypothetical protein